MKVIPEARLVHESKCLKFLLKTTEKIHVLKATKQDISSNQLKKYN